MTRKIRQQIQIGDVYTNLTIVSFSHSDKRWRKWYNVKCSCGKDNIVLGSAMTSGDTKSCGCLGTIRRKARRISTNHSEVTAIVLGYKRHAEVRGFKWLLTRSDVENIINKNCYYCGSVPSNIKKTKNSIGDGLRYSGIDRVNSNLDYTLDNTVPCCRICNYAKMNLPIQEFQEWARRLGTKALTEQWG